MASMPVSKARGEFAEIINRVAYGGERILIERRGKGVAALVPAEDVAILESLEDRLDLEAARKALREKGSIPWAKLKAQLGL